MHKIEVFALKFFFMVLFPPVPAITCSSYFRVLKAEFEAEQSNGQLFKASWRGAEPPLGAGLAYHICIT